MTTYLYPTGGTPTTVRDPDVVPNETTTVTIIGNSQRAVDGTMRQHRISMKRRWSLVWTMLDDSELSAILSALDSSGTLQFQPPTLGETYTVILMEGYERYHDGIAWGLRATLEEV